VVNVFTRTAPRRRKRGFLPFSDDAQAYFPQVTELQRQAGLGDLHVHDLRHTTGMRLREAAVPESTRGGILWHTGALEKIKDDNGCWNKSLATLKLEQEATRRDAVPGLKLFSQAMTAASSRRATAERWSRRRWPGRRGA
jgi:hypothetical protein